MDSGVHVWSTPLGYCDGDAEDCIKDEEEVSSEQLDGSFPDPVDPLTPAGDPLNIHSADDGSVSWEDPLEDWSGAEEEAEDRLASTASLPPSVVSLHDDSSDESADSQDPAAAMWFKAEPEDDSAVTSSHVSTSSRVAARPRYESSSFPPVGAALADQPCSPESALPLDLIDADSGRQLFTCKVCRVCFKQKMLLAAHYRSAHNGYKPHKCDICDKGFHKESFMRNHRKLHTNEKEFECEACGKAFICQARLKVHLKTARLCPKSKAFDAEAHWKRENGMGTMYINKPGRPTLFGLSEGVPEGRPLGRPMGRPVGRPVVQPVGRPGVQPVGRPVVQPVGRPVGVPVGRPGPVVQPVGQPVRQPMRRPRVYPRAQPLGRPIGLPMGRQAGYHVHRHVDHHADHQVDHQVDHHADHHTDHHADHQVDHHADHQVDHQADHQEEPDETLHYVIDLS